MKSNEFLTQFKNEDLTYFHRNRSSGIMDIPEYPEVFVRIGNDLVKVKNIVCQSNDGIIIEL